MTDALNRSIAAAVIEAIRRCFFLPDAQITVETRFAEDLALDSLDILEVAMALEDKFDLEFSRDVINRFRAVSDVVAHLSRYFFHDVSDLTLAQAA